MKRRYKLILAIIGVVAFLFLMFLWLTGNLSREGKIRPGTSGVTEEPAAGLKTAEVSMVTVPLEREIVGTVAARETIEISSRIMAEILEVKADAGDTVEKGQTLVVLDSRDVRARLTQAREALSSAEAVLEKASLDAGRIEGLYKKQAATKEEYDASRAALDVARTSVKRAEAAVREAEVNLSHTTIASPAAGRVVDRLADPGDMAVPGKPLVSIYDPSTLRLEVSVSDQFREKVHLGDVVRVLIDPVGKEFEGEIAEIVPASDASSRSFTVRVSIASPDVVYPGMYGRIWLPLESTEALLIPPEAVWRVGQLEMVTVVEDGAARTRSIRVGKAYPGGIEVLSGLEPGELVRIP